MLSRQLDGSSLFGVIRVACSRRVSGSATSRNRICQVVYIPTVAKGGVMTILRGDCPHSEKMLCRIRAGARLWIMGPKCQSVKVVKGRNALERYGRNDGVDGDFIG